MRISSNYLHDILYIRTRDLKSLEVERYNEKHSYWEYFHLSTFLQSNEQDITDIQLSKKIFEIQILEQHMRKHLARENWPTLEQLQADFDKACRQINI
jgi:pyruvate/2-oxoacid:ferredoxin oxidoreductase beta subunit